MKNPLRGTRAWWLRQFSDTAERALPAILDTLTGLGGGTALCQKVMEGRTFQGDVAGAETPIHSVRDILLMRDACDLRGVTFVPVVLPHGEDISVEAELHGRVAAACGSLVVDLEPYPDYWRVPLGGIPDYWRMLREQAPDAFLINQPDPRETAVTDARVVECALYYDGIAAQHYVGSGPNWNVPAVEYRRLIALADLGKPLMPTLWALGDADDAATFWDLARPHSEGLCLFAFGAANEAELRWGASLPLPDLTPRGPTVRDALDGLTLDAEGFRDLAARALAHEQGTRSLIARFG